MSGRYSTTKTALTVQDAKILADCYRTVQRLHMGLHYASPQQYPLMAASATLKAAWAEIAGEASAWSYSAGVPVDGVSETAKQAKPETRGPMRPIGRLD